MEKKSGRFFVPVWWADRQNLEDWAELEPENMPEKYEPYTVTPDLSSVWKLSGVGKNGFSLEGEDADRDGMGGIRRT